MCYVLTAYVRVITNWFHKSIVWNHLLNFYSACPDMKLNTHKIANAIWCVWSSEFSPSLNIRYVVCIFMWIIISNAANLYHRKIANTMEVIRDGMQSNTTCLFISTRPPLSFGWCSIEHMQSHLLLWNIPMELAIFRLNWFFVRFELFDQ